MKYRRRKKLIHPRLQLRLTGAFLGIATLGILLQFLLIQRSLIAEAGAIPGAGGMLAERIPAASVKAMLATLAAVLPTIAVVGVWMTFKFAGPLYRFERFLSDVVDGKQVEPCRLRKGDDLTDLRDLLNLVTEPARREAAERLAAEEAEGADEPDEDARRAA